MYKQMIYDLLKLLEDNHLDCYFNISKDDTLKYIEHLLSENELNDEYDFYYLGNKLIKKMFSVYDSHTKLIFKESNNLPIRLKYIDNKVYIIRTDENNKDLLYGEVLKINDILVSKLISEIINMTAYSTQEFLRMPIEVSLRTIEKLKSLPSIDNDSDEFNFEVELNDQIINRTLKKQEKDLLPINKCEKNYSMDVLGDAIHIVYNVCKEEYSGQMKEFVKELKDCSISNSINKFIVDLRGNTGGNSDIFDELVEFLNGKDVITLVDEFVFSGGRWALVDLNIIGSKFVGTGIGTALNCFGNVSRFEKGNFILPISNKYFYYENNKLGTIKDKNILNEIKNSNKELFEPIIFKPDYYVENSIEDIKNEYDRQLHSAEMLINNKLDDKHFKR